MDCIFCIPDVSRELRVAVVMGDDTPSMSEIQDHMPLNIEIEIKELWSAG